MQVHKISLILLNTLLFLASFPVYSLFSSPTVKSPRQGRGMTRPPSHPTLFFSFLCCLAIDAATRVSG